MNILKTYGLLVKMVETKEPEIIPAQDNTNTSSKGEKCCVYCIAVFFVVWIAAVIYVNQLDPSVF